MTDKSGFMKTPKLRLELAGDQRSYVTIGFPKGGKNEFLKALTAAIAGAKLILQKVFMSFWVPWTGQFLPS